MKPSYDLGKIEFATDPPTYERAVALYESGKVTQFREELNGFFAVVLGTKPYKVYIDKRYYNQGDCECYLGQEWHTLQTYGSGGYLCGYEWQKIKPRR